VVTDSIGLDSTVDLLLFVMKFARFESYFDCKIHILLIILYQYQYQITLLTPNISMIYKYIGLNVNKAQT